MTSHWPPGFVRIPSEDWTLQPIESLALKYDKVDHHGWYANLEPTVEELGALLREGQILIDYSGGTGILAGRLLHRTGPRSLGVAIVDSSPKFLRLALEKFKNDPRLAFRLIRYLKEEKRLQYVDEVLGIKADALVSTNAIHLYYDLPGTLASWHRILNPGSRILVQSGNIRNPGAQPGEWIIDETVEEIHREASQRVLEESRYRDYRAVLKDEALMARYDEVRRKFFLPVRPLSHYVERLEKAGFRILEIRARTIQARVSEWRQFLSTYHEGVLPWVGGCERVEGRAPAESAVRDRLALIELALHRLFQGSDRFPCCWTYITCQR